MATYADCEHAERCDKCKLFHCAKDELIVCKCCYIPRYCAYCFYVKGQDPKRYIWYCDNDECMIEARKNQKKCSRCRGKCIKHTITIYPRNEPGYILCRRCDWRRRKKEERKMKKK